MEETELKRSNDPDHTPTPSSLWQVLSQGPSSRFHAQDCIPPSPADDATAVVKYKYIGDVVVDRPFQKDDSYKCLIDRFRHIMDPFQVLSPPIPGDGEAIAASPFELLLRVMQSADLPTQTWLCQLLLDHRSALPIVMPQLLPPSTPAFPIVTPLHLPSSTSAGRVCIRAAFQHNVQAICSVQVKHAKPSQVEDTVLSRGKRARRSLEEDTVLRGLKRAKPSLVEDTVLPRVVFLSKRSPKDSNSAVTAQRVLHCLFGSQCYKEGMLTGPVVELGIGFLGERCMPCLAFHVCGDYRQLKAFLEEVAEVIVVEIKPGVLEFELGLEVKQGVSLFTWEHKEAADQKLTSLLEVAFKKQQKQERKALGELCKTHFSPNHLINLPGLKETLDAVDFANIRAKLTLQSSFAKEASKRFEALGLPDDPIRRCVLEWECQEEESGRASSAREIVSIPLVQLFVQVLMIHQDPVLRWYGVVYMQQVIQEKMQLVLEQAAAKEPQLGRLFGLHHLWRELCHIFVADPVSKPDLPRLAAQHLLDGFPLEILDGDAAQFCGPWVTTVLKELDKLTRSASSLGCPPKVFILSVLGFESSGHKNKSTLLNLMFGIPLHTSAAHRRPHGVLLHLLKSDWPSYDYVLLLDTEGLSFPTFAIRPADACVVMVSIQDDIGLKEVLSTVLLSFEGSTEAQNNRGRVRSKVFFAYGSVEPNQQSLWQHLTEATKELLNKRGRRAGESDAEQFLHSVFGDFHVDKDEDNSDVKWLGNLKKERAPPDDTPDWAYGERLVKIRKYIHERVTGERSWSATGLKQWSKYLKLMSDGICTAHNPLWDELFVYRRGVSEKFENLEATVQIKMMEGEDSGKLHEDLEGRMSREMEEQRSAVEGILEDRRWQKWKVEEEQRWKDFCFEIKARYKHRLEDCINGVIMSESVMKYYERVQTKIVHEFSEGSLGDGGETFQDVLESILKKAQFWHKPFAAQVEREVKNVYRKCVSTEELEISSEELETILGEPETTLQPDENLWAMLKVMVENHLRVVKQYSGYIVEVVIRQTSKQVKRRSRQERVAAHRYVREILMKKLLKIQQEWDKHIATQAAEAELRLCRHCEKLAAACDHGREVANLVFSHLQSVLGKEQIVEAFRASLVVEVAGNLQKAEWVGNWTVMRACGDYHLLILMENHMTDQLLELLHSGAYNHKLITGLLIHGKLATVLPHHWQWFVAGVTSALQEAKTAATRNARGRLDLKDFIAKLQNSFKANVKSLVLADAVSSINPELYAKWEELQEPLEYNAFDQKVDELCCKLCRNIAEMPEGMLEEEAVVQSLMREMTMMRPRCEESCPRCGLSCFHPLGHSGRHDTCHQPQGLAGIVYTEESGERAGQLVANSCLRSVLQGEYFYHNTPHNRIVSSSYQDFDMVYQGWELPSRDSHCSAQLREYFFYKYQTELIQCRYPTSKKCDPLPEEYNHNLHHLRNGLLQNQFSGDSSIPDILERAILGTRTGEAQT